MAARPEVQVFNVEGKSESKIALPEVFLAPIRPDVVRIVHRDMKKNSRQAQGVTRRAGHQATAESWGTGRAVARIPRAGGGGTHRSGQGAYGNQCRGGHMFSALKVFRKWHRRINRDQRRYATVSALAASAVPALVMARGHKIDEVNEFPVVIDGLQKVQKTKDAVKALKAIDAEDDCARVTVAENIRSGAGKMRNRRYTNRRGPLIVFADADGVRAFRNISGIDTCNVESLNLLQLAPGGHVGRFIVWTKAAFEKLPSIFGGFDTKSSTKKNYTLPRPTVTLSDVQRVLNSAEVAKACRARITTPQPVRNHTNPFRKSSAMFKLNPHAKVLRGEARLAAKSKKVKKTAPKAAKTTKPAAKKVQAKKAGKK
ncbi:60S ribosomal protein L4-2 [Diplonema papillatum]|nr:60S ribosomal protein L4-2 [Diplonema papillatum]KAJ9464681.1 60S ribosomal protein L4-2 [Diplonema papillatum]KAJ9464683.1 60S ribosomal protein L4-2 [Diplonema papillatum]